MPHLYELTAQMKGLQAMMDEGALDEQTMQDTLEGLETDIREKGEGVLLFIANLDGDIKAYNDEIKRLTDRKRTLDRNREWLVNYLRSNMEELGITKIECPVFTATLRNPVPMVEVYDEKELPMEYQTMVPASFKINKKQILDDLKNKVEIPGARLVDSKRALVIR